MLGYDKKGAFIGAKLFQFPGMLSYNMRSRRVYIYYYTDIVSILQIDSNRGKPTKLVIQ